MNPRCLLVASTQNLAIRGSNIFFFVLCVLVLCVFVLCMFSVLCVIVWTFCFARSCQYVCGSTLRDCSEFNTCALVRSVKVSWLFVLSLCSLIRLVLLSLFTVCLFVCLFVCLLVFLFGCLVVWLFGCWVAWLFVCLFS
jgi:hypothetical protein